MWSMAPTNKAVIEKFVLDWNSSSDMDGVVASTGFKEFTCRNYASAFRRLGYSLKYFPGHGSKKRILRDGIPTCRLCSCVLTQENWPTWDKYKSLDKYPNYCCRDCCSEDRKRRSRLSRGASMEDDCNPEGRQYPKQRGVDFDSPQHCNTCSSELTASNWRRYTEWSMRAPRQSGYPLVCNACRVDRRDHGPWKWLRDLVHGANYCNSSKNASGRLTLDGMKAKWTGRCHWCDRVLKTEWEKRGDFSSSSPDHVIPVKRGGLNTDENVVWSCWECNDSKGNRLPEEWLDMMERVLSKHRPAVFFSLPASELPPLELVS